VLSDASGEYVVGSFDGMSFRPDRSAPQRLDLGANDTGGTFYAGQTFTGVPIAGQITQGMWVKSRRRRSRGP
jgi:fructan beta-fructosidase